MIAGFRMPIHDFGILDYIVPDPDNPNKDLEKEIEELKKELPKAVK